LPQIEPEEAHQQVVGFSSSDNILFPELIQLNSSTKGRPVFWFHGVAGVMVYKPVAEIIDIDSSSHMTMFSEEKSRQTIIKFCETLYSEK
jgi:hypothetical protein